MIQGQVNIPRRDPRVVMRLKRLGSLHQSRLSFMRILLRRMAAEGWQVTRPIFDIGANGVGRAVYQATGPERAYSLVCFARDLPADLRSDRVIAEAWDATFTLFDGIPTEADLHRLQANVPLQEAGRVSETELSLSRANRSVRLWVHVIDALAEGQQPDPAEIDKVGYLMRTTAVYGSGKFGAADREVIADRPEMQAPFQAEMLSVYLIRTFVRDLAEHMAQAKGRDRAVRLDPALARRLGIGNSTGLGMAPFIINHPVLFNNWIMCREEALARVRAVEAPTAAQVKVFKTLLQKAGKSVAGWQSQHPIQVKKLAELRADLDMLATHLSTADLSAPFLWDALVAWSEDALSEEGQEVLASLLLEPYPDLVDGLAECLADPVAESLPLDGAMTVAQLRAILEDVYDWALPLDWSDAGTCARAWYVSAEKLEPRLGERFEEPAEAYEQPLAPARAACALHAVLRDWPNDTPISDVLMAHPVHRTAVRRAQFTRFAPYAEIRDNTIAAEMKPIDMLRAKLSFFGATRFDPRSDRWVRIAMYQGAPYPEDLSPETADLWVYDA
ncbi:MAG: hypothetical protein AAF376_00740 [Pseudomonadota bacterium]